MRGFPGQDLCRCCSCSHHVVEVKARVGQLEVFEQTVELPAVERAPGAVEVVSGLRLLPGVVVVLELEVDTGGQVRSGPRRLRAGSQEARRQTSAGAAAQTHLVEDAELLSQLRCDLFSSGLHFAGYRLFHICSRKTSELRISSSLAETLFSGSLGVCAALRVLGLASRLVSQLRVARGLATGAVERSEEWVVQRRVNCRVGPWEKLSNGGKH